MSAKASPATNQGSITRTWVYHVDAMLLGDLDDLISGQVCSDGGVLSSLANHVGFIGFYGNTS